MTFDIITIFPDIFKSFLRESLIARAQKKGLIKINIHNLRKWTSDKHKSVGEETSSLLPRFANARVGDEANVSSFTLRSARVGDEANVSSSTLRSARVDDRPYGGGSGMVLKVEPIFKAVNALKKSKIRNSQSPLAVEARRVKSETNSKFKIPKSKTILFTPRGKKFNQRIAYSFSQLNQLILICGRYEGVDERVAKYIADLELSVGDYDLMGGDLPAMLVMETVSRLIPGVLGKPQLLKERITKERGFIEYPQYTRPEVFETSGGKKRKVPKVLISGDHKKIVEWRKKHRKIIGK